MANLVLTGATGFVGRHVAEAFGVRGHTVATAQRSHFASTQTAITSHQFDLLDRSSWPHAFASGDATTLVHLADGCQDLNKSREDAASRIAALVSANIEFVRFAESRGVSQIIYVSSVRAAIDRALSGRADEETFTRPDQSYGECKHLIESALRERSSAAQLIIMRPPLIFGPGVGGNFLKLMQIADSRWPLPMNSLTNRRSIMYVANLADAVVAAVEDPLRRKPRGTFMVADAAPVVMRELMLGMRSRLGRPGRLFDLPLARGLGRLPVIGRTINRLSGDLVINDALFRATFGWEPLVDLNDALDETVQRYLEITSADARA